MHEDLLDSLILASPGPCLSSARRSAYCSLATSLIAGVGGSLFHSEEIGRPVTTNLRAFLV